MNLFENFLNTVAYTYYPKNLHQADELYFDSKERNAYLKLYYNWKLWEVQLEQFLNELKKEIDPKSISVNQTCSNFPCFEVEIFINKNEHEHKVLTIYISFLIPCYHIVNLNGDRKTGVIKSDFNISKKIYELVTFQMKEIFNYIIFPNAILNNKIPQLIVTENFNYFKAFFTDGYRIAYF